MIHTIEGRIGAGKSYYAVAEIVIPALKKGRDVFVNFTMHAEGLKKELQPFFIKNPSAKLGTLWFYSDFEQLKYVRSGVIIIDEAQDYIDSQKFYNLPSWFKVKLSQNRKIIEKDEQGNNLSTDVYALTQAFERIDINFRRYSYNFIRLKRTVFGFGFRIKYDYSENAKTQEEKFRRIGLGFYSFRQSIFDCYNSFEMIKSIEDMAEYKIRKYEDTFPGKIDINELRREIIYKN